MIIKYLHIAIEAALAASREIMAIYNDPDSDFGIERKADNSPLTRADVAAHRVIESRLSCCDIPLLSEEGRAIPYSERSGWSALWVVDPIDGTKEFIKRNGEFTVNIAYVEGGVPRMGVIYAPALGELYYGCDELGSFKVAVDGDVDMERILSEAECLSLESHPECYTVVASRSHMSVETEAFVEALRGEHECVEIVSRGSSLKICLVAEGLADVYPRYAPTMEWDTAAGDAILRSMGEGAGLVDVESGELLLYNKSNLLNPYFVTRKG